MKKLLAIIGKIVAIIIALIFINWLSNGTLVQFICEIKNALFTK